MRSIDDGMTLQQDLNGSQRWLFTINEDNCKVLHIGRNNSGYEYHLGTTSSKETVEEKGLGFFITKK